MLAERSVDVVRCMKACLGVTCDDKCIGRIFGDGLLDDVSSSSRRN